jgi:uncharacterized membrane protein YtjA (UPF0391 family)
MLVWALMFSLIALVAGALGLLGIAGAAAWLAWFTLGFCAVLFVVMLLASLLSPSPKPAPATSSGDVTPLE